MTTNVRVKKITTASKEAVGRSNVYHDLISDAGDITESTLVGKLRKTRGTPGYDAFVMNVDGSRSALGNFGTRSGAAHAARKAYMVANGKTESKTEIKTESTKEPVADSDEQAKREARNARRRELRAAAKAA